MTPRRIVISGASRGIGEALAKAYAGPQSSLILLARDPGRLDEVADACRAAGAQVRTIVTDVRERDAIRAALQDVDAEAPVDLVIANAGVALPSDGTSGLDDASYGEIDVNLTGALNTILPLVPAMVARGRGQIALMSSLAAYAPLADAPAYGATKAALLSYGLALRERLRPSGVQVSVVCPGFVATGMGARYQGWRPLEMSSDRAAARIRDGLSRDKAVIAFPRRLAALAKLGGMIPPSAQRLALAAFRFEIGGGREHRR